MVRPKQKSLKTHYLPHTGQDELEVCVEELTEKNENQSSNTMRASDYLRRRHHPFSLFLALTGIVVKAIYRSNVQIQSQTTERLCSVWLSCTSFFSLFTSNTKGGIPTDSSWSLCTCWVGPTGPAAACVQPLRRDHAPPCYSIVP